MHLHHIEGRHYSEDGDRQSHDHHILNTSVTGTEYLIAKYQLINFET
jgi:hypothetical protein